MKRKKITGFKMIRAIFIQTRYYMFYSNRWRGTRVFKMFKKEKLKVTKLKNPCCRQASLFRAITTEDEQEFHSSSFPLMTLRARSKYVKIAVITESFRAEQHARESTKLLSISRAEKWTIIWQKLSTLAARSTRGKYYN